MGSQTFKPVYACSDSECTYSTRGVDIDICRACGDHAEFCESCGESTCCGAKAVNVDHEIERD